METFKDIIGLEGKYQISNYGNVKSIKRNIILKQHVHDNKYLRITIPNTPKPIRFKIHRLVATHFIPNPYNKPQVNHIDGNKLNNHVSNLEWVTDSENKEHAFKTGLQTYKNKKRVLNTITNEIYNSIATAAKKNNFSATKTKLIVHGKHNLKYLILVD